MGWRKRLNPATILTWGLLILLAGSIMHMCSGGPEQAFKISFGQFIDDVEKDKIKSVLLSSDGLTIKGELREDGPYITVKPDKFDLTAFIKEKHQDKKIEFNVEKPSSGCVGGELISWIPFILLFAIFYFFMKNMSAQGNKAIQFGKARTYRPQEQDKKTFEDVAGVDEAQERLEEVVDYLKNPKRYTKLGARTPKGVLLIGGPGTGKTLMARAVAGESDAAFFYITGSDFVEMFVGVGASRVRDLFEQAKKNAPAILFIDEIDAVGRHRGTGIGGGHDEREQTLNQILAEMDGFQENLGVIVMAATNRPDVLDPALLRPGRFDLKIVVQEPHREGREKILEIHTRNMPLAESVDLNVVARGTPQFSGADLENLCNEAALNAARQDKEEIEYEDFHEAKEKVQLGEKRRLSMSKEEKKAISYHEAGHTLMSFIHPKSNPVELVTITPRGLTMGVTWFFPEDEIHIESREMLEADIWNLLGGRAAEEAAFGFEQVCTGARNDLTRATEIVRKMIAELGMDSEFGLATFGSDSMQPFLGRVMSQPHNVSDITRREIDKLIKKRIKFYYEKVKTAIEQNITVLHDLARALLEHEVLDRKQIEGVVERKIKHI